MRVGLIGGFFRTLLRLLPPHRMSSVRILRHAVSLGRVALVKGTAPAPRLGHLLRLPASSSILGRRRSLSFSRGMIVS